MSWLCLVVLELVSWLVGVGSIRNSIQVFVGGPLSSYCFDIYTVTYIYIYMRMYMYIYILYIYIVLNL